MQKYRVLTKAELNEFEKEFISFLVINGVDADSWLDIKKKDTDKADKIIEQFSDVIFESLLRKTMFIEHISDKSIKCFQCLSKEIILVGLDAKPDSDINFLGEQALDSIILNRTNDLEVYQTKKKYSVVREEEMFNMLEKGAQLSKGQLFKQISLLL